MVDLFKHGIILFSIIVVVFQLTAEEIRFSYTDGISVAEWKNADWASKHLRAIKQRSTGTLTYIPCDVTIVDKVVSLHEKQMAVALAYAFCRYSLSDEALGIFPFRVSRDDYVSVPVEENFSINGVSYTNYSRYVSTFAYTRNTVTSTFVAVSHTLKKNEYQPEGFQFMVYVSLSTGDAGLTPKSEIVPLLGDNRYPLVFLKDLPQQYEFIFRQADPSKYASEKIQ